MHPSLRLIDEPFMRIEKAMAVPRAKAAAVPRLDAFPAQMDASGFIEDALGQDT